MIKSFFIDLWYEILQLLLPKWVKIEFNRSLYCPKHRGNSMCDCMEQRLRSEVKKEQNIIGFENRSLRVRVKELEGDLFKAKSETKKWHDAWFDQRDATGKSYWKGYSDGKQLAVSWHTKEAERKRACAKGYSGQDKVSCELDARYHEWSAEHIRLIGYDQKN